MINQYHRAVLNRSQQPGVQSGHNAHGAMGPMQFKASAWAQYGTAATATTTAVGLSTLTQAPAPARQNPLRNGNKTDSTCKNVTAHSGLTSLAPSGMNAYAKIRSDPS